MPPRSGWALRRPGQGARIRAWPGTASGRNPARANAAQSRNINGIAPGVEMPSKAEPHDGERPGLPGIAGASASLQGAAWVGPSLFPDFTHGVRLVSIRHSLRRIPCA